MSPSRTLRLGLSPYPGAGADAPAFSPVVHTQAFSVTQRSFSIARTPLTLPDLAPGLYDLFLIPGDLRGELGGAIPADAYVVCRLSVDVDSTLCWRSRPDVVWDETIALRGVDWHKLANSLHITFEWEALQAPQADHKFFVHVLPERSEGDASIADTAPIVQFDGMPCGWSCPTCQWEESDAIVDRVRVDLRSVPAGTVKLAIGWYDPNTQERLPGVDASGQLLPEGRFLLDETVAIPAGSPH